MPELGSYVACIAEGGSETAILDLLLDHHLLIFDRNMLIDEKILNCRSASAFESRYLRMGFKGKITVFRVLDSRRENFKLSKACLHKVDVINVITAPEIEMLIILNENKYQEYKKSGLKPNEFCKGPLKMRNVKSPGFVKKYFADVNVLMDAIRKYASVSKIGRGEYTLLDLLRDETRLPARFTLSS